MFSAAISNSALMAESACPAVCIAHSDRRKTPRPSLCGYVRIQASSHSANAVPHSHSASEERCAHACMSCAQRTLAQHLYLELQLEAPRCAPASRKGRTARTPDKGGSGIRKT